jgi:hypothetical protein
MASVSALQCHSVPIFGNAAVCHLGQVTQGPWPCPTLPNLTVSLTLLAQGHPAMIAHVRDFALHALAFLVATPFALPSVPPSH